MIVKITLALALNIDHVRKPVIRRYRKDNYSTIFKSRAVKHEKYCRIVKDKQN